MTYRGSCHCGRIAYEAEGSIDTLLQCNCSICSKKGYLLWFVPRDAVQLQTALDDMATYTFKTHRIKHTFCPVCGCSPLGFGSDREGNESVAINARCLDDVDIGQFPIHRHDGRSQ